jgi:hypothetical protein
MARDHARMQTGLWRGGDWRALTSDAQWAYEMLCQQDALSYAGVVDYRPGRFAALAADMTARKVEAACRKLEAERFVIIDRQTEELLVRTYVRHDGVLDRTNMGKAVGRALAKVVSLTLYAAIITELARHYGDKPTLSGWDGLGDLYPDVMDRIRAMSSTIPFPMASGKA